MIFYDHSKFKTITYQEAEILYGLPTFIKMDIEGGELEFFNSMGFKSWLIKNSIFWLVEVHRDKIGFTPMWEDIPYTVIDTNHYLYCKDINVQNRLIVAIKQRNSSINRIDARPIV